DERVDPPNLASAFRTFEHRMTRLLDYANAVAPSVKEQPDLVSELGDSVVVLAVTRLDAFYVSLVSLGTQPREREIRKVLQARPRECAFLRHAHPRETDP